MYKTERARTRDRLLEYDFAIVPPLPHSAGLSMVYPWEDIALSMLSKQIYTLAQKYGYTGLESTFWSRFTGGSIISGTIDTFPVPGNETNLYFDTETEMLYYFKVINKNVAGDLVARIGAAIVGISTVGETQEVETYIYIPIRALPLEDIIFNSGGALD